LLSESLKIQIATRVHGLSFRKGFKYNGLDSKKQKPSLKAACDYIVRVPLLAGKYLERNNNVGRLTASAR
jgi:hypothetical protein